RAQVSTKPNDVRCLVAVFFVWLSAVVVWVGWVTQVTGNTFNESDTFPLTPGGTYNVWADVLFLGDGADAGPLFGFAAVTSHEPGEINFHIVALGMRHEVGEEDVLHSCEACVYTVIFELEQIGVRLHEKIPPTREESPGVWYNSNDI